ncbi:Alpha/Beta hydrolase protein [Scheffersomyces xylosifermentans]|uniref:Alpha/Beta hydrolase protein n=1 Tax=Scheffersomyces xylosifermentans TaxID=1304137 RepID=UPI00315DC13D
MSLARTGVIRVLSRESPYFLRRYSKVIDLEKKAEEVKEAATSSIITDKYSNLRDNYNAPHYPIVLCHGFSGFDKLTFIPAITPLGKAVEKTKEEVASLTLGGLGFNYWHGIKEALQNLGSTVFIAKVPPFGRIKERAETLDLFINKECEQLRKKSKTTIYHSDQHEVQSEEKKERSKKSFEELNKPIKVNLISHSMGGLDSRYLISKLQSDGTPRNYKVVSLTTVSTPHHGSECADFVSNLVGNNSVLKAICPDSIFELTTESMAKFNESVPDDPSVEYFSYGARFDPKWYSLFNLTWHLLKYQRAQQASGKSIPFDNDGMVAVESAKWGNYLGTLDEVDHLDLINWTNRARTAIDKVLLAKKPKFNAIALYLDIADNLSKRGF